MAEYNGYVGAPYNFTRISKKVNRRGKLQPHNVIDQELKSGTIEYEIEAVTPLFVSAGKLRENEKESFYKDCYGREALPGSTIRGLVRSNVQILSCSSVVDDIQDGVLMYRNVAAGKEKEAYNHILGSGIAMLPGSNGKQFRMSVLKNVKAGYIRKESGHYMILPTVVDQIGRESGAMNYYVVSERKIMEDNYRGFEDLKKVGLQHQGGRFNKDVRNGRVHYKGRKNNQYRPYIREICYSLKGTRQVTGIALLEKGSAQRPGMKNGYLLSSGPMNEKKAIYVIPQIDEAGERIPIPQADVDNYRRDYENKKNQIETIDKQFYRLPEDGEIKPVFYIHLDGKLYFGFTPRLRLFYKKSIHEGLGAEQKKGGADYCKRLFGYTTDEESYRSRLSFLDAGLRQEHLDSQEEVAMILGGPKPTSYLDYLRGSAEEAVSYNDDFELRGIKQYWLKDTAVPGDLGTNDKVASSFRPCRPGTAFRGEIRFRNLTDEELGMVLWGLLLEKDSQQNIGKGKPYGYGRIKVRLTGLKILNPEALYSPAAFCLDPYGEEADQTGKKDQYIQRAKDEMTEFLGRDVMSEPGIRDFLLMKDAGKIPPKERTRYMKMQDREYQSRVRDGIRLPSVESVIRGDKVQMPQNRNGGKRGYGNQQRQNGNGGKRNFGNGNDRNQNGGRKGYSGNPSGGGTKQGRSNSSGNRNKKDESMYSSGGSIGTSLGDLIKASKK